MSTNETLGHPHQARGDDLPEAQEVAGELDVDHAPAPGGLQEIGTCRTCGLLIARDGRGVWTHRPSVGEIEAGEMWIDRNRADPDDPSAESDAGRARADPSTSSQAEGDL